VAGNSYNFVDMHEADAGGQTWSRRCSRAQPCRGPKSTGWQAPNASRVTVLT
jgi:hypothetical protein